MTSNIVTRINTSSQFRATAWQLAARLLVPALIAAALPLRAAEEPQHAARMLRITRVTVKPGGWKDYVRLVAARSERLRSSNWSQPTFALRALTGPKELLYVHPYGSYEDWQKEQEAVEADPRLNADLDELGEKIDTLTASSHDFTVRFRKDISYRGEFDWAAMRDLGIITIRLRMGHHREYSENRKIVVDAHARAKLDYNVAVYQMASGEAAATYMKMIPVPSLHGIDILKDVYGPRNDAVLSDEQRSKLVALYAASAKNEEEDYFAAEPELSYVTDSWIHSDADRAFWAGRRGQAAK